MHYDNEAAMAITRTKKCTLESIKRISLICCVFCLNSLLSTFTCFIGLNSELKYHHLRTKQVHPILYSTCNQTKTFSNTISTCLFIACNPVYPLSHDIRKSEQKIHIRRVKYSSFRSNKPYRSIFH